VNELLALSLQFVGLSGELCKKEEEKVNKIVSENYCKTSYKIHANKP
jgi:hypothetical protein